MTTAKKRLSPAQIRLQKDFEDVPSLVGVEMIFPDPDVITHFIVRITPQAGLWQGGKFDFNFLCSDDFPFERPQVTCLTRIWHPNIDEQGAVCLNILRDSYTPVMSISHLIAGIQFLFDEPNPESPLNTEASEQYVKDPSGFRLRVQNYMREFCPE